MAAEAVVPRGEGVAAHDTVQKASYALESGCVWCIAYSKQCSGRRYARSDKVICGKLKTGAADALRLGVALYLSNRPRPPMLRRHDAEWPSQGLSASSGFYSIHWMAGDQVPLELHLLYCMSQEGGSRVY